MGKYLRILLFFITQKSNDLPRRGAFEHGGFVVGHKVTVHGEGVAIEVGADIDAGFIGASRQCQVEGGRYGSAEDGEVHEDVSMFVLTDFLVRDLSLHGDSTQSVGAIDKVVEGCLHGAFAIL